jgi:hypothetical protein
MDGFYCNAGDLKGNHYGVRGRAPCGVWGEAPGFLSLNICDERTKI